MLSNFQKWRWVQSDYNYIYCPHMSMCVMDHQIKQSWSEFEGSKERIKMLLRLFAEMDNATVASGLVLCAPCGASYRPFLLDENCG